MSWSQSCMHGSLNTVDSSPTHPHSYWNCGPAYYHQPSPISQPSSSSQHPHPLQASYSHDPRFTSHDGHQFTTELYPSSAHLGYGWDMAQDSESLLPTRNASSQAAPHHYHNAEIHTSNNIPVFANPLIAITSPIQSPFTGPIPLPNRIATQSLPSRHHHNSSLSEALIDRGSSAPPERSSPSSCSESWYSYSPTATSRLGCWSQQVKSCSHCRTTTTPLWRREPTTLRPLCNACGLYFQTHHRLRPQALIDADVPMTEVEDGKDGRREDVSGDGPECSHCKTRVTTVWRRNKERRIVCNACGVYERMRGKDRPLTLSRKKIKPRPKQNAVQGDER